MIPGIIVLILVCVLLAVLVNMLAPEPMKRYLYAVIVIVVILWALDLFGVLPLGPYGRLHC